MNQRYAIKEKDDVSSISEKSTGACLSEKADEFINYIVSVALPEVDVDAYTTKLKMSVHDYALQKAEDECHVARHSGVDISY